MIVFTHPTITNASNVQALLDDDTANALLVQALDMTPAECTTRANDLERFAVHSGKGILQTLAGVIRHLSAMDIAAIKKTLAAA
jgi:hypothetical protein